MGFVLKRSRQIMSIADPVRLQIPLPVKPALRLTGSLALSPDGRQLAFSATGVDGVPRMGSRPEFARSATPAGLGVRWFSIVLVARQPDIAFDSGGKLQKIDISGGPAETVCA